MSTMTALRKIIFYTLALFYLIVCPLLILYSLGYILTPSEEAYLTKTGDIVLSTVPQGASVSLNGKNVNNKTPLILNALTPGQYDVEITLQGYASWSATLPVTAGKAVALEHIILLKDPLTDKKISEDAFENIIYSYDNSCLLFLKSKKISSLCFYLTQTQETVPLSDKFADYGDFSLSKTYKVKNSVNLILEIKDKNVTKYLSVLFKNKTLEVTDVTELFISGFDRVMWDPDKCDKVFLIDDKTVNMIDVQNNYVYPKWETGILGLGVNEGNIFILKDDFELSYTNYDKSSSQILLDDKDVASLIFSQDKRYEIFSLPDDIMVFMDYINGGLYTNKLPYKLVQDTVLGLALEKSKRKILFWQKNKIGIIDFLKEITGAVLFEKGPKLKWAYDKGVNIEKCVLIYEGSHVLFNDSNRLFLYELEDYGQPHIHKIADIKNGTSFFYLKQDGDVYFIDSRNSSPKVVSIIDKSVNVLKIEKKTKKIEEKDDI